MIFLIYYVWIGGEAEGGIIQAFFIAQQLVGEKHQREKVQKLLGRKQMKRTIIWTVSIVVMICRVKSQYRIVRVNPLKELTTNLKTHEVRECEGGAMSLQCPEGSKVRKLELNTGTMLLISDFNCVSWLWQSIKREKPLFTLVNIPLADMLCQHFHSICGIWVSDEAKLHFWVEGWRYWSDRKLQWMHQQKVKRPLSNIFISHNFLTERLQLFSTHAHRQNFLQDLHVEMTKLTYHAPNPTRDFLFSKVSSPHLHKLRFTVPMLLEVKKLKWIVVIDLLIVTLSRSVKARRNVWSMCLYVGTQILIWRLSTPVLIWEWCRMKLLIE